MDKLQAKVNENLAEGLIVKNYKEMCSLLDETITDGNGKKAQLKQWKRYFDFDKEGQKFIVTKVFAEPIEKNDDRGKSEGSRNNNAIYVTYIQSLLLYLLSKQKNQTLVTTKNHLLVELGITDKRYTSEVAREILIKVKSFKNYELNEFNNRAYQTLDRILFTSLNNLKRRCLIDYYDELHYRKISETTGKPYEDIATDDERRTYTDAKRELLDKWGYKELRDIYYHDRVDEFYVELTDRMYDIYQWDMAFVCYRIIFNKNNVIRFIPKLEEELNQLQIKQQKLELNGKVIDALNNNAQTKYDNMLSKFQREYDELCMINNCDFISNDVVKAYLPPKNYVERQQMITEELVRIKDSKSVKKVI